MNHNIFSLEVTALFVKIHSFEVFTYAFLVFSFLLTTVSRLGVKFPSIHC